MEDSVNKSPNQESEPIGQPFAELPGAPNAPVPQQQPISPDNPNDLSTLNIEPPANHEEQPVKPRDLIPQKTKKSKNKTVIILLVIIALIALAGGVYALLAGKKDDKPQNATPAENSNQQQNEQSGSAETSKLKTYKNDTIKIELSYLSDWTLKEDVDKVILTSPKITYKKKDGTSAKNSFKFLVQKGINQVDSNTINTAVAVKISELIKYTAPAEGQRTETYLSFVGKNKDAFKFFLVSSGKQYNPEEKVAGTLPLGQDSYIVAGGYGTNADDSFGFDEIAIDDIDQDKAYTQAVDIVKSLKLF